MTTVAWLDEPAAGEAALVGGKGVHLAEMTAAGLPVPPGFVVTTAAYRAGGGGGSLPAAVADAISEAYARLASREGVPEPIVAVRSSATAEDLPDASFAGQQATYLGVRGAGAVLAKVAACWASLHGAGTVEYRRHAAVQEAGVAMGVVVQTLVDASAAGVLFTLNPVNGDRSKIVVEAAPGLGEAVVGGEVTPDRWMLDKVTFDIRERVVETQDVAYRLDAATGEVRRTPLSADEGSRPALSDDALLGLARLGKRVEALAGGVPQDVEWAVRRSGELVLLQCRPETVWSRKPATPKLAPNVSALDLVAGALVPTRQGGRP